MKNDRKVPFSKKQILNFETPFWAFKKQKTSKKALFACFLFFEWEKWHFKAQEARFHLRLRRFSRARKHDTVKSEISRFDYSISIQIFREAPLRRETENPNEFLENHI